MRRERERGAALATVLVMLALLATLAIVAVDAAGFSLKRTANQTRMDQARWLLLGAETYAAAQVERLARLGDDAARYRDDWQGRELVFPIENGEMRVTLWDAQNCLNLNSLVGQSQEGSEETNMAGFIAFARLMDLLQLRGASGMGLSAAAADWIDADRAPRPGGAEDESYGGPDAPYLPANARFADLGELAHVRGFDANLAAAIAPYVCVRAPASPTVLNVNSLRPEQAVLLAAMFGRSLSVAEAEGVLRARPRGGWETIDDFFATGTLGRIELSDFTRAQFTLTTSSYVMIAHVRHLDVEESSAALIRIDGGQARIVRRVFGVGANARML
jgi:general secretion pathway protein K